MNHSPKKQSPVQNSGETKKEKKSWIYDIILVLFLLSLALLFFFLYFQNRAEGENVRVEVEGKTVGIYPLSETGEYVLHNGSNVLKIENGKAYMLKADCKNQLCVKTGKISHVGERIVCLPNEITVTVMGEGETVDAITK